MTGPLAPAIARCAALAGQMLGWRPAEFWAATPAELALMLTPLSAPAAAPLSRAECARLMEHDHD